MDDKPEKPESVANNENVLPTISFDIITKIFAASTSIGFLILLRYCIYIHFFPTFNATDVAFLLPSLAFTGLVFFVAMIFVVYAPTLILSPYVSQIFDGKKVEINDSAKDEMDKNIIPSNILVYGLHYMIISGIVCILSVQNFSPYEAPISLIFCIIITFFLSYIVTDQRLQITIEQAKGSDHRQRNFIDRLNSLGSGLKAFCTEKVVSLYFGYLNNLAFNAVLPSVALSIQADFNLKIVLWVWILVIVVSMAVIAGTSNRITQQYVFYALSVIMIGLVFGPPNVSITCMKLLGIGGVPNVSLVTDKSGSDIAAPLFGSSWISDDHFLISNVFMELNLGSITLVSDRLRQSPEATHFLQISRSNILAILSSIDAPRPITLLVTTDERGNLARGVILPNTKYALITSDSINNMRLVDQSLLQIQSRFIIKNPRYTYSDELTKVLDQNSINKYFLNNDGTLLDTDKSLTTENLITNFNNSNKDKIDIIYSNAP